MYFHYLLNLITTFRSYGDLKPEFLQEFEDFATKRVKWLEDKEYDYTTKVEKTIENLTEFAKREKYFDNIKDTL